MADPTPRRSPLHHLAATGDPATVHLAELPFRTMVDLRADSADRLAEALGAPLPRNAGETTAAGARHVLWLGPGWWLLTDEPDPDVRLEPRLVTGLRTATAGTASIVDVSAHRTTLRLTGPHARAVLEHGCSLDLRPRAFPPGTCAATMLAKAQVILHHTAPDGYRILVGASFADYLARWLLDAMTEYTAPVRQPDRRRLP